MSVIAAARAIRIGSCSAGFTAYGVSPLCAIACSKGSLAASRLAKSSRLNGILAGRCGEQWTERLAASVMSGTVWAVASVQR